MIKKKFPHDGQDKLDLSTKLKLIFNTRECMVYTPLRVINKSRMTGFTHTTQLWNIRCTQTSLTDAMVMVQHGSNTIKSEAVKAVLLHPPAQVWQQEPQHFPARKTHTRAHKHTHSRSGKAKAVNYSHISLCTLGTRD